MTAKIEGLAESSPRFRARIAGFLYLLIILEGLFAPFAIAPSGMMLGGPSLTTLVKIQASRSLYTFGGIAQLMVYACDLGVVGCRGSLWQRVADPRQCRIDERWHRL
jgi:hypothetical protein